jgi:ATP-binding protein involved in chromosome partitioning
MQKKKAICVCAVKGGVGKTLLSMNIAKLLTKEGRTALIDADLDNSSFSQFTGIDAVIEIDKLQRFKPFNWEGMEVFSMGLVTSRNQSVSMQGDRYVQIVDDVITRSVWNSQYYVFDMPGGSSDVFRSVIAIVGDYLAGNIVVTQPAMVDSTRKMLGLHEYLDIPVLGVIENMSYFQTGEERFVDIVKKEIRKRQKQAKTKDAATILDNLYKDLTARAKENDLLGDFHPFGESTVDALAAEYGVPVLGKIPLDPSIAEGIKSGNPFLDKKFMGPIKAACKAIIETDVRRPGFLQRIKETVSDTIKSKVEEVMAGVLMSANREFNLRDMRQATGFTEERPFLLVITDRSGHKELTRVGMRVTENAVKVKREPKGDVEYAKWVAQFEFQIVSDFQTFARIIMGKWKKDGRETNFAASDAFYNGDIKAYGLGYLPRAVKAIRSIFEDEDVMRPIREKYGSVLMRWV